jgi:hypothetical protein
MTTFALTALLGLGVAKGKILAKSGATGMGADAELDVLVRT